MQKNDQSCYEKIQGGKYEVSLDVHMQSVHNVYKSLEIVPLQI